MSATISVDKFADYMGRKVMNGQKVPILSIPGYTFPVVDYYRQQYEEIVRYLRSLGEILRHFIV